MLYPSVQFSVVIPGCLIWTADKLGFDICFLLLYSASVSLGFLIWDVLELLSQSAASLRNIWRGAGELSSHGVSLAAEHRGFHARAEVGFEPLACLVSPKRAVEENGVNFRLEALRDCWAQTLVFVLLWIWLGLCGVLADPTSSSTDSFFYPCPLLGLHWQHITTRLWIPFWLDII